MNDPLRQMRADARAIFDAAVRGADAGRLTARAVRLDGGVLHVGPHAVPLAPFRGVHLFGIGKAAVPMAAALEEILGDRITGGRVVTRYGCGGPLRRLTVREAGHPLPDGNGLRATGEIVERIRGCGAEDLVLFVVSGGGSALFVRPAEGITLQEKIETTRLLLRSGAPIGEINAVRRRLSAVKGGRLLAIARPAPVVGILLSDVPGDRPEEIASGPTVPPEGPGPDPLEIVERYGLAGALAPAVRSRLGAREGPPGENPPVKGTAPVWNALVGGHRDLLEHARRKAGSLGYEVQWGSPAEAADGETTRAAAGEAREAGKRMAQQALALLREGAGRDRPVCLLVGGETTVTVRGDGAGGRCQEFALAASIAIAGAPIVCLAAGSDGIDGPTDAAGAVADGRTRERAREGGLDPADHLARNDSHAFFDRLDGLIRTGPTRTNVLDLYLFLLGTPAS